MYHISRQNSFSLSERHQRGDVASYLSIIVPTLLFYFGTPTTTFLNPLQSSQHILISRCTPPPSILSPLLSLIGPSS
jgi:hypothetical protein